MSLSYESTMSPEPDDDEDMSALLRYVSSEPLSSEALNYEYLHGRRYHGFHPGQWLVPNDEKEEERMTVLHFIWKKMNDGRLTKSVLRSPKRILDVGTGTGNWAIEIADQFPNADVVGTDLSPIQDSEAPPNCHFFVDDCQDEWGWEKNFDLIHARSLGGAITNWRHFYRQCFKNTVSGGQVEIQEHDFKVTSQTKDIPKWISHWQQELNIAYKRFGKELQIPVEKHIQYLKDAGFTNVKAESINIPIGPWAKDERLKKIGEWNQRQMLELVESYSLAPYTEILKKTLEETQVTLAMTKSELREKKHHLIIKFHFITGTKPLCK